jgi:hypothetical protein
MNAEKLLRPEPVTGKNVTAAPTSRREVAAAAPTNVIEPAALAVRPPKQKTVAAAAPTINVAVAPREVAAAAPTNVIEPAALAVRPPKQKTVAAARREVAAAAPTNDIEPAAFAFRLPKQKTFAAAAPTIDVAVAPTPPDAAVATAAVDNAANETPPPVVDEHQLSLVRTHASVALARSARAQLVDLLAARRIASDVETSSGSFEFLRSLRAVSEPARETIDVFDGLQQRLRDAIEIDDELVKQRDDARASLVHAANALVAAFDAVGADAMADARGNLQRCASAVGAWPCSSDAGGDGSAWILDAESRVRQVSDETDKRVGELMSALAALASAFSADSEWYDSGAARHATATVRACAVAAECECSVIKQLRVPHDVSSALHNRIKSQLAQLDDIVALVDRARGARMCEAPDGGRLLAAQRSLKQARKQVAFAEAELAHADDDDDHDDLAASLAKCKAARAAAVDEESAAVLALGAAMNDFPELVLRFPSARLDVLSMSVVGGEATTNGTLRTLDAYDQRVELASARNVVERASIGGVSCALKLFALGEHGKRAFLKEARQLRQLAHPNVVELRAAFIDNKSTRELVGVIEMPLYEHGSLWAWLSAADRGGVAKIGVLRQTLCGLEHVHRMGVVHGDVKPDNVFVDAEGVAKLGDFDVSHDDDSSAHTDARRCDGGVRRARVADAAAHAKAEQGERRVCVWPH